MPVSNNTVFSGPLWVILTIKTLDQCCFVTHMTMYVSLPYLATCSESSWLVVCWWRWQEGRINLPASVKGSWRSLCVGSCSQCQCCGSVRILIQRDRVWNQFLLTSSPPAIRRTTHIVICITSMHCATLAVSHSTVMWWNCWTLF